MFYFYRLVRGTVAINIFIGIVIIWASWKVTELLNMRMTNSIVGGFMQVGLIALIIVFQQEIRRFLVVLGSTNFANKRRFAKHFKFLRQEGIGLDLDIDAVLNACRSMGKSETGAILIIERDTALDFVTTTGDTMKIQVNQPILESIFFKNSPLHDGAAVIKGNTIVATRVILPISRDQNIPQRFGLRHRAALGITERSDALALVVSEESGLISYIRNGEFVLFKDLDELEQLLRKDLN
jgi:uncharacterized protein (TIGR00159 family)